MEIFLFLSKKANISFCLYFFCLFHFYIVMLICYIIIGCVTYPEGGSDVHNDRFNSLPVATSMTIIGLLALFLLSSYVKKYPKFIQTVGKNSFVIYMLDRYLLLPFIHLYKFFQSFRFIIIDIFYSTFQYCLFIDHQHLNCQSAQQKCTLGNRWKRVIRSLKFEVKH